jgi:uncharacterized membrane-anchored protein
MELEKASRLKALEAAQRRHDFRNHDGVRVRSVTLMQVQVVEGVSAENFRRPGMGHDLALYLARYSASRSFLAVFSELMYLIFPKIGRSGPQALS